MNLFAVDDIVVRWVEVLRAWGLFCCVSYMDKFVKVVRLKDERLQRKLVGRKCGDSTVDGGAEHCCMCNNTDKTQ